MMRSKYERMGMPGARLTAAVTVAVLIIGLSACSPSREERMQSRWEDFVTILPEPARDAIEARDYALAAVRVDSALTVDTAFASKWSALKKSEAIELFSTADVIDYFVTYFGTD